MTLLSLERLSDWDRRLADVTERHASTAAAWGVCDCLLAAADAVEAVTGIDPAADVRGSYSTEEGALLAMRERGAENVEEVLMQLFPECGRLQARRGDLCTVDRGGSIAAGYVTILGVAVKSPRGLVYVPQTEARKAFTVG